MIGGSKRWPQRSGWNARTAQLHLISSITLILMLAFSFLQLGHYCQLTACVMSPCSCSSFHFLTIILSVAGSFTASFFLSLSSSPIAISDSNCPQVALFFPVSLSVHQVPSWCLYLWLEEREELSDTSSIVQVFLYDIKYPVYTQQSKLKFKKHPIYSKFNISQWICFLRTMWVWFDQIWQWPAC